jgi:predicted PurR-regulated permease PerM
MKRVLATTAVIFVVVLGALALWQMREMVQLFLLALVLASGLEPTIRLLTRRNMRRTRATALTFGATLVSLILGMFLFGSLAYADMLTGIEGVPAWYETTRRQLASTGGWQGELGRILPQTAALVEALAGAQLSELGSVAFGLTTSAFSWSILLLSIVSLGFYWLLDQPRFERLWLSLLPLQMRVSVRAIWKKIFAEVGIYVRGVTVIVTLTTVALAGIFSALQVPGAVLLAVMGGLAQVIPLLGVPIALLPAVLALVMRGPVTGALTFGLALLVMVIIKGVVAPRLFRHGVNTNPVLVILLIMAVAKIGGLMMIVLAPPLAAAIQTSLRLFTRERASIQTSEEQQVEVLQEQLDLLEQQSGDEEYGPQMKSLLARARNVLDRADEAIGEPAGLEQEHLLEHAAPQ